MQNIINFLANGEEDLRIAATVYSTYAIFAMFFICYVVTTELIGGSDGIIQ